MTLRTDRKRDERNIDITLLLVCEARSFYWKGTVDLPVRLTDQDVERLRIRSGCVETQSKTELWHDTRDAGDNDLGAVQAHNQGLVRLLFPNIVTDEPVLEAGEEFTGHG